MNKALTPAIIEAWMREIDPNHDKRFEEFREFFIKDRVDARITSTKEIRRRKAPQRLKDGANCEKSKAGPSDSNQRSPRRRGGHT